MPKSIYFCRKFFINFLYEKRSYLQEIAQQLHSATSSLVQQVIRNDFDDEVFK